MSILPTAIDYSDITIIGDINNTKYVIFNIMLIINLLGPRTSD